jgi:glycosyltransferase involved in cell wall biosynthesis
LISQQRRLKVCYILAYYFPQYVRTKTLIAALRRLEGVEVYEATNRTPGILRYTETFLKLLWIRFVHDPDWYILGFRGWESFWPARLITLGRQLVFDQMMSPYDSLVHESDTLTKGSILARLAYLYERAVLTAADVVLTDTRAHQRYFARLFQIPSEKIHAVYVGTDETLFRTDVVGRSFDQDSFIVLFYGSFLPLHGVDVILEAAASLRDWPIHFVLVGGSRQDLTGFHRKIAEYGLTKVEHCEWVDYCELPRWIAGADLCLGGPFGATGQGGRVVTGKTFQFLAMAKPTIVGETEEGHGFIDKDNCLLISQGDPVALADAVLWAFENQDKLSPIGTMGYELFLERFSVDRISQELELILSRCESA